MMTDSGFDISEFRPTVRNTHIPCARCEYDLFGLREENPCPECGCSIRFSLDCKRLFFSKMSALHWCRASLGLGLVYYACCSMHLLVMMVFVPPLELQLVSGSLCMIVGAVALSILVFAHAYSKGGIIRTTVAVLLGIGIVLYAVLEFLRCQTILDYLSGIAYFESLAWDLEFEWMIPNWIGYVAFVAGACSYHTVSAWLIARVPNKRAARMLYVAAALVGITAVGLFLGDTYSGTPVAYVFFLLLFLCFALSIFATSYSIRILWHVISLRRTLDHEHTLSVGWKRGTESSSSES